MVKIPKNCKFYHVQEIQGLDKPTKGPFDLRKNVYQLLGDCDYKNKSVLELGPASGFITFFLENLGAKVSCIDLSIKKDEWDTIPHVNVNWKKKQRLAMKDLSKVRNAFWFAHKQNKSNAKLIETHILKLPKSLPIHDYGLIATVLLHIQNPFLALRIVSTKHRFKFSNISKSLSSDYFNKNTFIKFLPRSNVMNLNYDTWWKLSPATIIEMMSILGFKKEKYLEHVQYCNNKPFDMYTIVFKRQVKIRKNLYFNNSK